MTRLASPFGAINSVRRDRPLTQDELSELLGNRGHHLLPTDTIPDGVKRG